MVLRSAVNQFMTSGVVRTHTSIMCTQMSCWLSHSIYLASMLSIAMVTCEGVIGSCRHEVNINTLGHKGEGWVIYGSGCHGSTRSPLSQELRNVVLGLLSPNMAMLKQTNGILCVASGHGERGNSAMQEEHLMNPLTYSKPSLFFRLCVCMLV